MNGRETNRLVILREQLMLTEARRTHLDAPRVQHAIDVDEEEEGRSPLMLRIISLALSSPAAGPGLRLQVLQLR
jgi:hypothetical protein